MLLGCIGNTSSLKFLCCLYISHCSGQWALSCCFIDNHFVGPASGLDRFEVREKLWKDLEEIDLAVEKKPYTLRVPRSQRGGEVCFLF